MLTNPALAKVVFYNCDVFSTLKITRKDEKEDDLINLLKNPNFYQTQRQWLWMFRFWLMFGTSYLLPNNKRLESDYQSLYWLEPQRIDWGNNTNKLGKLVRSKKNYREVLDKTIKYKEADNSSFPIKLKDLVAFHDLANGTGNFFKGGSRIDALWKVLVNNESSLDAKNINLEFARKFLVSGNHNIEDISKPVQNIEKENIVQKLRGKQAVHPIKSQVDIKRFVENLAQLQLDESYNSDLGKIGNLFNIPGDVLEALKENSTYENQEKSTARHIQYSETPKAMDLLEGLCKYFDKNPEDYELSFADNSFMKVFEKDQATINMTNARTLDTLVKNGANPKEVAELLGWNDLTFKNAKEV